MITVFINNGTRLEIYSYNHTEEVKQASWFRELTDIEADPNEIREALRIADEGTEETNAAIRVADNIGEELDNLPDKPLKADLLKFVQVVRESYEESGYAEFI